jgi:hypothetical protein
VTSSACALLVPDNTVAVARHWPAAESVVVSTNLPRAEDLGALRLVVPNVRGDRSRGFRGIVDPARWGEFQPTTVSREGDALIAKGIVVPSPEETPASGGRKRPTVAVVLAILAVALMGVALTVVASHAAVVVPTASGLTPSTTQGSASGRSSHAKHDLSHGGRGASSRPVGSGGAHSSRRAGGGPPHAARIGGEAGATLPSGQTAGLVSAGVTRSPLSCTGETVQSITACARHQAAADRRAARQARLAERQQERHSATL